MKQNLSIIARLKPGIHGCDYSGHFREQWLKNDNLHPFAKSILVKIIGTGLSPSVKLYCNGNVVLEQKGNQINPAKLQQFILDTYCLGKCVECLQPYSKTALSQNDGICAECIY